MSRFSRITAAKIKRKIRISNRQCQSKFPRRGSKTKYEKKNLKSGLWKKREKFVVLTNDITQNFLEIEGEVKQNTKRNTES